MKECRKCHMTVDAHSECPICYNDIANEPESSATTEKYRINKYFFIHLLRNHKFSLVCTILVLIAIFIKIKAFGYWQIISIILDVIMWVEALYKNLVYKIFSGIYSDRYLEATHKITVYMCGALAAISAFL